MKTEVYSWRVSRDLKENLEQAARSRKKPVASILDEAARQWLEKNSPCCTDDAVQQQMRDALMKCVGTFADGNRYGSENVSRSVKEILRRKHDRHAR